MEDNNNVQTQPQHVDVNAEVNNAQQPADNQKAAEPAKAATLQDMLKDPNQKEFRADFDRYIGDVVANAQKKMFEQFQKEQEAKEAKEREKQEWENKLKGLGSDPQAEVELLRKELEKEREQRAAERRAIELKEATTQAFTDRNIPRDFMKFIDFTNNDEATITEKVDFLDKFFKEQEVKTQELIAIKVQEALDEKLAEKKPLQGMIGSHKDDQFLAGLQKGGLGKAQKGALSRNQYRR